MNIKRPYTVAVSLLFAVLALSCLALFAAAQAGANDHDINRTELQNFDRYLDSHPDVAQELRKNPNLVNDPKWMSQHHQLQSFLSQHPGVREELKENPSQFMSRENQYGNNEQGIRGGQVANADQFLDSHPQIAHDLQHNPGLVDNQAYLAKHPQLQQYLQSHPEVRREWKEHPEAFMSHERQYENGEKPPQR